MSTCNPDVDAYQSVDADLDVIAKYKLLMQETLSDDSIYMRAKDTYHTLFSEYNITEAEKAKIVVDNITALSQQMSSTAMQTAVQWAKEERDGAYQLAKVKAETMVALVNIEKGTKEICLVDSQTDKVCAETMATVSASFRENGIPTGYEEDGCKPTGLDSTGLKYEQTKLAQASAYQVFADAFRKSGVVTVAQDANDNIYKGISGDEDGFTHQQQVTSERQRVGFEDSKRNHAANSAAAMIGQLLSSETLTDSNAQDVDRWREAIDFLNTSHSSTSNI